MKFSIGPLFFLFVVLLVLKATVVTWSWWWITAPLWIPLGVSALLLAGYGVVQVAYYLTTTPEERKRDKALRKVQERLKRMRR